MEKANWDAKHKSWHSVLTLFMRAVWGGILVIWGFAFLCGAAYFWFYTSTPLNLIGGIPLFMMGLAFVLLGPMDFLQFLFSAKIRRGVCSFCEPVPLRDFLVPNSINNHFKKKKGK